MLRNMIAKYIPLHIYRILYAAWVSFGGRINQWFFGGSAITCQVCHHSFRKFLPAGYRYGILYEKKVIAGGYRENATCPYCRSSDRERLVTWFLQKKQLLQPGMRLLHIAPEWNLQQHIRKMELEYYAADYNSPLADIKMDIQQIEFGDGYFDAIICNHVLEHVPDDMKAMKELFRVLKPGGWTILQVPFSGIMEKTFEDNSVNTSQKRKIIFGQRDHVRIYGLDYSERLSCAGFIVQKEKMEEKLLQYWVVNPEEYVFFCQKK